MKFSEFFYCCVIFLFLSYVFVFLNQEQTVLLIPLISLVSIGFFALFYLMRVEGKIELFDAGALLIAITSLYSIFPLMSFAFNGFETTVLVDNRFKENQMTASKMGLFAWNHVIYLASLTFSYLYFRPKNKSIAIKNQNIKYVNQGELIVGLTFMAFLTAYSIAIPIIFGDSFPYFIKQLNNNFGNLFFVMSIWFFAVTFTKWNNKLFRILLFAYLAFEIVKLILGMSGRTWFALHALAFGLLYHRLIKPFNTRELLIYSFAFLFIFLLFGYIRTGQSSVISVGLGFFTGNEEFTALFATAYDVHRYVETGESGEIPLSILLFDLNHLIPSQFLPFEKIAQTDWYVILKGLQDDGVGFGFGAISQGMIGFGKIDLAFRGIITGTFFAYLQHRLNKVDITIWELVLYVFLAIKAYHTFRSGTGYIIYFIIYQFLPCYLLMKFILISSNPNSRKLTTHS